jgi:ssRNA-specific RNase YbeY (16S rRNA maturation enzyme)
VSPSFSKIKEAVLGKRYDLSFAFLAPAQMRKAMKYKKMTPAQMRKHKVSNVLSFPLSKTSGEILICKAAAKPYSVGFLFIHGALHLKGLKHGAIMEREEGRLLRRFGLTRNG